MTPRLSLLCLTLVASTALGSPPRSDLEPLRWLAGEWQGDGPTGRVEAFWLPPGAGTMVGALRRIREGRVLGYALATVVESDGSLVLRFKRFDPALAGRESQESPTPRRLVTVSDSEVTFEGIRLRRSGETLLVELDRPGDRPQEVRLTRMVRRRPVVPPAVAESPPVVQDTPGANSPSARASAASWMAGDWTGQGLGGVSEEAWLLPAAGSLAGVYRGTRSGQVTFYELMTVVESAGSLVFRLKHFAPDLRGWESPESAVEFPLVRTARSALYFDGLTYRRTAEGLESWVVIGLGDGGTRRERFLYTPRTP
ncbi:MAG TPA: DUF6265 family protein [Myxococcaceae bacterium]|nr:DUF6265 family protein [Myxococcaceae bacterium]